MCRRTLLPGISSCEWHNLQIEFSPPQQLLFPVKFLKILRLACLKRVCKIEEVNLFCKRFIDSPFPQFNFEKLRPNKDQIVGEIIQSKKKKSVSFHGASVKHKICIFRVFLPLRRTASQPYRLNCINGLRINQFYLPKDKFMKFSQKNFQNWRFWKTAILKNRPFWIFFFKKKNFFASFLWKYVQICMVEWMGQIFDVFPVFQQIPCFA